MKQILSKIALADNDYGLIQENDIIAVGVSGGKDSTLLLYALELYRQKYRKNFKL
jgi:tRNA 2-thiocytidine biosynthesis protein TtcA